MAPVNPDDYNDVVARINRKYINALKRGDEIENPTRLTTGSLELDLAMGGSLEAGYGIPIGRVTRLAGPFSCGKSLIALSIIAAAQKIGMKCAYYNVEKQYTPNFAEERGVNIHDLNVVDVGTIEAIAEVMDSLLGVCHLHVIDSTKQAVSEDALAASVRDWRPGLESRAWGKAWAFINERFDYSENVVVMIDQVRIKNFQTGSDEPAGGKWADHASSMTTVFRKGSWLFYDDEGNLTDKPKKQQKSETNQAIPAGRVIQARVEKSRVSRPLLPATMWLDLNTNNFDRAYELVKHGKATGVLRPTKEGSSYYEYNGTTFHGEGQLRQFVKGDLTVQEEIREAAMRAIAVR